jgi:hypothetical protein
MVSATPLPNRGCCGSMNQVLNGLVAISGTYSFCACCASLESRDLVRQEDHCGIATRLLGGPGGSPPPAHS